MDDFTMDGDGMDLDGGDTVGAGQPVDLDGDGTADALAAPVDLDRDGQAEAVKYEAPIDLDRDGIVDGTATAIDANADGVVDELYVEQVFDSDGDGIAETSVVTVDSGADGTVDATIVDQKLDTDADGRIDTSVYQADLDGDGVIDEAVIRRAIDSDGDGTLDTRATLIDSDGDGQVDTADLDGDGTFETVAEAEMPEPEPVDQYPDHTNFDASSAGDGVVGDPGDEMEYWHQQTYPDTCAVVSQEYILESLTGEEFDEDALRQEAIDNGWYTPGAGTPLAHVGDLLEAHGIDVEREYGGTLDDLDEKLDNGQKVIVAIDADETWETGRDSGDDLIGDVGGIPGQDSNHAVEVIGIDRSDPDNPMVILNDPGHPDGKGMMVPADEFMDAWEDSGCYMVSTV